MHRDLVCPEDARGVMSSGIRKVEGSQLIWPTLPHLTRGLNKEARNLHTRGTSWVKKEESNKVRQRKAFAWGLELVDI